MKHGRLLTLAALFLVPALAFGYEQKPTTNIGDIHFENSGAPEAQASFLRGVAALHNFWFDEAADEFRNAQEIDPDFAMAYWGEAMSYNHPLWAEQDIAAARQVMRRFGKTRKERLDKVPTEREKMYWEALETLYGRGDKLERDIAYEKAMARIQEAYPEDFEAAAFHAVSILGTVRPGDKGFYRQVKAGTIALDLFAKNPNHPGAAHYVIHSFDDPEHAPLALKAAERYAEIAPESSHALHMPTHIFVQHGMWDRVAQSNLEAFRASEKWVARKNLSVAKKDYHSLEWRAYANAQRGVWHEIADAIKIVHDALEETDSPRLKWYEAIMTARYLLVRGEDDGRPLPETEEGKATPWARGNADADMLLALGLGAAKANHPERTEQAAKRMAILVERAKKKGAAYRANYYAIMMHELQGAAAMARGETEAALTHLAKAVELEETQDPPSGPAGPIKPSHELYGELLAKAGKHEEAMAAFRRSLKRTPNRTASLLGLARSAQALGDTETASSAYKTLRRFLKDADPDVPFLAEVRGYGASTDSGN